jgi:hypothetical protein
VLFLAGCGQGTPATGAQVAVQNGDGTTLPRYLLFDWGDNTSELVRGRRVPDQGFLDPAANPLAVVRIAASAVTDPDRHIAIRGMVDDQVVSQGEASVRLVPGSWQTATVVLIGPVQNPDAAAPPDGAEPDAGAGPVDASEDQQGDDVTPPDVPADSTPLPTDAGPPDLPLDLPGIDLPRDLAPEGPAAVILVSASADSYAEQGSTASSMNFGKATTLEVKSQTGADNNRIAFFRFPLTALAGATPLTATLRLYGKASAGNDMLSAYGVTDQSWTETGITWNNKPALGAKLSTLSIGTTAQFREWNVTAFVKAQAMAGWDNVNLGVSMDNDTAASPDTFNAREATSNQPQLIITY